MLGYRGLVFMYNGEQPTSHLNWTLVDFAEAQFLGLHTATWFLLGAALLLFADVISRSIIAPSELPIGIVTAVLGAPVFLWILFRQRGVLDL